MSRPTQRNHQRNIQDNQAQQHRLRRIPISSRAGGRLQVASLQDSTSPKRSARPAHCMHLRKVSHANRATGNTYEQTQLGIAYTLVAFWSRAWAYACGQHAQPQPRSTLQLSSFRSWNCMHAHPTDTVIYAVAKTLEEEVYEVNYVA